MTSLARFRLWGNRLGAALLVAALAVTGCAHPRHEHKGGPPPWAPAHGYRHKHENGVELVFDSKIGIYVVVGRPGHYFHRDRYYRSYDGRWQVSVAVSGPWNVVSVSKLPPGLRDRAKKRGHHRGKPGKRMPAKHGY
jgi:hypothetical protein